MTQDIEQYRAGFEAWARKENFSLELGEVGHYLFSDTSAAWFGWCASKRDTSTSQGAARYEVEIGGGFFAGCKVTVDPSLPPDTVEMRGANRVRMNIKTGAVTEVGAAQGDALDARRYRAWRDEMLGADDESNSAFMDAIEKALPIEFSTVRAPTADEWDAAIDAAILAAIAASTTQREKP